MNAVARCLLTVACVTTLIRPAAADFGGVYLYTLCQSELPDDLEAQLLDRLAEAHLHSPLEAEHVRFFIRIVASEEGLHYSISQFELVRDKSTSERGFMITGTLEGIQSALDEVQMAFQQGSLYQLKSGWRSAPVEKPMLKKDQ